MQRAKRWRLGLVTLLLPHLGDDDNDNVSNCHDDSDDVQISRLKQ